MALLQVGQKAMAEKELLLLQQKAKDELDDALLAVSQTANLPSLALKMGATQRLYGDSVDPGGALSGAELDARRAASPSTAPCSSP